MIEKIITFLNAWLGKLYVPADKQMHGWIGMIIFVPLHPFGMWLAQFWNPFVWAGIVTVWIAAIGKELYDRAHKDIHTPDIFDAIATAFLPTLISFYLLHR